MEDSNIDKVSVFESTKKQSKILSNDRDSFYLRQSKKPCLVLLEDNTIEPK